MYEQIGSNIRRSYGLVFVFVLVIVGLGYLFGEATGYPEILPLAVAFAIISSIGSYYYSDKIVIAMAHARPAAKEEYPHLVNSVEGLAIAAGLPVPKVYVIDDSAPNAFATGRNPEHAALAVTTGLLDKMDRTELEGVIGHEMAHVKGYDIRFMTLVAILAGMVVLISDWLLRSMRWGRRNRGNSNPIILVIALAAAILAPIFATLIQLAISRRREFLADAQGALLTRYPDGLANALEKISADHEPLEVANKATAHMWIANPLKEYGGWVNNLFSTHPPVEERIQRLRAM